MKSDKRQKRHELKTKIREEKKRVQRIGLAFTIAILIVVVFVSGSLIISMLNQPSTSSTSPLRAVIVDHLSLTAPNQTFIQTATNILVQAGYTVDYYQGEKVTVELYRNLPTHGYKIVILRVHSTGIYGQLFTSESYDNTKYVYEQLTDRVIRVTFDGNPPYYFGISPLFVNYDMKGNFQDTVIIMMGCNGLTNTDMAKAFVEKGAKVYVSWSESVLASHTDQATTQVLQHLILEKQTVKQAVDTTMSEVGPDPASKSQLIYYPLEAGDYTIQNMVGNLVTDDVKIQHRALFKRKIIANP